MKIPKYSQSKRAEIYLECAKEEFNAKVFWTQNKVLIKYMKGSIIVPDVFPELELFNGNMFDLELDAQRQVVVMAYLLAHELTSKPTPRR